MWMLLITTAWIAFYAIWRWQDALLSTIHKDLIETTYICVIQTITIHLRRLLASHRMPDNTAHADVERVRLSVSAFVQCRLYDEQWAVDWSDCRPNRTEWDRTARYCGAAVFHVPALYWRMIGVLRDSREGEFSFLGGSLIDPELSRSSIDFLHWTLQLEYFAPSIWEYTRTAK